ncbi:MAG: SAM-dependent methyltransferase [Sulfobacillus acidophilus]|uniref:SAM-dependent methyltransferase n=1 Tax=Sulfobacillus acidophilus TaxID=53633 RepID=A0A2T2WL62_9FIRM|nr:MAG: SAM-dependent methyltransferase [Sulfobacillus acidophilus]
MNYREINSSVIDRWVDDGWEWGMPISHQSFVKAVEGTWHVLLTPTKSVPAEWFPPFPGCKILGLAAGGGQQMPVFAALGAECTVMDYSQRQLGSELIVATREGYSINLVKADMTERFPFEDASFDMIFHPVSNCYLEEILPVWRECHRVLTPGGVLMAGMDNGINYIFDEEETILNTPLPFNPLRDDRLYQECLENDTGIQFSHTLDELLGGQLKVGFMLTDLYEDTNGSGRLHEYHVPTYIATRAIKQ